MSDNEDETEGGEETSLYSPGDLVVSLDCGEAGRVTVAAPSETNVAVIARLLDLAVEAIGKLKTQMQ